MTWHMVQRVMHFFRLFDLPARGTAVVSAAALSLSAAACGGPDTIERADLEKEVRQQLSDSVGQQAPAASCPKTLKAEVGAMTRCSMTFDDGTLGITVKVKEVADGNARFDITADDKVQPAS